MLIISCNKKNIVNEEFIGKINSKRDLKILSKDYPYIFFVIKIDNFVVTSCVYYNGKNSGNIIEDYYNDELFKSGIIDCLINIFDEDKAEENFINGKFFELISEKDINDEILDFIYRKISILDFYEIITF